MPRKNDFDANEHLAKAVSAIEAQIAELQNKKAQLQAIISGKTAAAAPAATAEKPKRQMSEASKEKIRAAQRKRWADAKKKK